MPTCVYLHPLRTIVVGWEADDDGVPTITSYADHGPGEYAPQSGETIIVHSDNVLTHRFPDDEGSSERQSFEVQSFMPEVDTSAWHIRQIRCSGLVYDHQWSTVLAYVDGDVSDIECDMKAISLDGDTLFLGRRGRWWWFGSVRRDGTVHHLDRFAHVSDGELGNTIRECIDETISISGSTVRRLIMFGDVVTPAQLKDLAIMTQGRFDLVDRSNPFRHVRAAISPEQQQGLLRRAHLLGTVVGVMFSS